MPPRADPNPAAAEGAAVLPLDGAQAAAGARSSLEHYLDALRGWLAEPGVTELCINRPGEAFVERAAGWTREAAPFASYEWCWQLARLVANHTRQRVSAAEPLLAATLPGGARIQVAVPPATAAGCVSITIRRPADVLWTLDELAARGVFNSVAVLPAASAGDDDATLSAEERALAALLRARRVVEFLKGAVRARKTILLSGATGSGKTTVAKALILEIPPEERLVSIEDTPELSFARQPNHVRLFYSQGGQGLAQVTAGELLVAAKRQRPDRVIVSEVRTGDEAYDYLVSIASGHPGSIASVHADSAAGAFVALATLLKRSAACAGIATREAVELAQLHLDIVVQCRRTGGHRHVTEVWYDPHARRRGFGA